MQALFQALLRATLVTRRATLGAAAGTGAQPTSTSDWKTSPVRLEIHTVGSHSHPLSHTIRKVMRVRGVGGSPCLATTGIAMPVALLSYKLLSRG